MARANTDLAIVKGTPRWLADYADPEDHVARFPAKLDAAQFRDLQTFDITLTAGITANDTTATIADASPFPAGVSKIPSGTQLWFGTTSAPVTLSADYTGGTTLHITAAPTNVSNAAVATYKNRLQIAIPSGTFVGRTYTEQAAGTNFGPAHVDDDEVYLVLHDVIDLNINPNVEFARNQCFVKQNYLPEWTAKGNLSAPISTGAAVSAVNEVQTVTLSGSLSAGQFKVGGYLSDGSFVWSADIAYNAILSAIQTGYDTIFGANKVVVAGTVGSHTVTFSGTGYAGIDQPLLQVDANEVTGITEAEVQETTKGVTAITDKSLLALLRSKYQCITGVN
jgi:hypothetical protein